MQVINKEAFMKKVFVFCMTALLLAFSLALFSCAADTPQVINKFTGTWVSTSFRIPGTVSTFSATMKFGSKDWTLTVPGVSITEKGDISTTSSDYSIFLYQNGLNVGQAQITNDTLTVSLRIAGSVNSSTGQFRKQP
jgi:hypothetical protein